MEKMDRAALEKSIGILFRQRRGRKHQLKKSPKQSDTRARASLTSNQCSLKKKE
jgi:hypothetical protein